MSGSLQIVLCVFGVLFVTIGSTENVCETFIDLKEVVDDCSKHYEDGKDELSRVCNGLICAAQKCGIMVDGKLIKENEQSILAKVFPDASDNLKSKLAECFDMGNREETKCQVIYTAYKCVFNSTEHMQEMISLVDKKEHEH